MPSLFHRVVALFRRLRSDRAGNVLMIFGFALVPLSFATGMTIDYARAARLQTRLNAVTDAAALAGVTPQMLQKTRWDSILAIYQNFYAQAGVAQCQGTADRIIFYAGCPYSGSDNGSVYTFTDGTLSVVVTDVNANTSSMKRTVQLTYAARSGNIFGNLLGMSSIPIGGTATSRGGGDKFFQIVFVVDVSNSMAIGGTAADVANLSKDKTITCSFACHDPNGTMGVAASDWCNNNPTDYFCHASGPQYCPFGKGNCTIVNPSPTYSDRRGLAKLYGYKLKIDYVKDAINSFIAQLKPRMDASPQLFNVGIDTFGTKYSQLQTLTNNSTTLQNAANNIDVEIASVVWGSANQGWTYTSSGLAQSLANIKNIGDGTTATKRATYVIFLSDGVEDVPGNIIYGRQTTYDYAQKCQAIKDAGANIFSIEAAYPVVTDDSDGQYNQLVTQLPVRNSGKQIADVMKACASGDDKYIFASDGPAITTAANNVFSSIFTKNAVLSQ